MVKQSEGKGKGEATKTGSAAKAATQVITVVEADATPYEQLMKIPKAQILRTMTAPENKTRFMVDVDNTSPQGKGIIGLMEFLCHADPATNKALAEILSGLAKLIAKGMTSEK